jgi:hypothetical protein
LKVAAQSSKTGSSTTERIAAAQELIDELRERDIEARLLGGVAIALHCPGLIDDAGHREIGDIDIIVPKGDARALAKALPELEYEPDRRFNAVHGSRRLIFEGPSGKLDVFIESFSMCHELKLAHRVELDYPTVSVSDLLMTKLQIVELNAKDAHDLAVLLTEHELGSGPGDHIDSSYLAELTGSDWGLWRTTTGTLETIAEQSEAASPTAKALHELLMSSPKTRSFRLRARVGERVQWYELPDDLD